MFSQIKNWVKGMFIGRSNESYEKIMDEHLKILDLPFETARQHCFDLLDEGIAFQATKRMIGTHPSVPIPNLVVELFNEYERIFLPDSCVDIDIRKFEKLIDSTGFIRIAYDIDGSWVVLNEESGEVDVVNDGEIFDADYSRENAYCKSIYHWLIILAL